MHWPGIVYIIFVLRNPSKYTICWSDVEVYAHKLNCGIQEESHQNSTFKKHQPVFPVVFDYCYLHIFFYTTQRYVRMKGYILN